VRSCSVASWLKKIYFFGWKGAPSDERQAALVMILFLDKGCMPLSACVDNFSACSRSFVLVVIQNLLSLGTFWKISCVAGFPEWEALEPKLER
jgi:hypothetical protein